MTFRDWQNLSPEHAAREVHRRLARLSSPQRRAAVAWLRPEEELARALACADPKAPLRGVPFFAKDLFDVPGVPTFAGSTFLPEVRPEAGNSSRFVQDAIAGGLVLAGKTHLHEFAYGITGENPHYGDCEHPKLPGRTSGGSSSGSAAVVAAGITPVALGTDTGGSIRVPAAFCGLFGYRGCPRDPRISDAFPLAPSFDTAGWFTANATDMRTLLDQFVGHASCPETPRGCYVSVGDLDTAVGRTLQRAAARIAIEADDATASLLRPVFADALRVYNAIVAFEAWDVHQAWAESKRDRYDPVVWTRLNRVHELTPADLTHARQRQHEIRAVFDSYFRAFDFLVLPATPCAALTKAECSVENRTRLLTLTAPASVAGLPVLTIPIPLDGALTTGLQIIVPRAPSAALFWVLTTFR